MDKTYYNSFDLEEMGLTYEAYVEFCHDIDCEPEGEDSEEFRNWQYTSLECEWDELMYSVKDYDYRHSDAHYHTTATFGLWNGTQTGCGVFPSLENALYACIGNCDYIIVRTSEDGGIEVEGIHHDGRNYFTIRRLTDDANTRFRDTDGDTELTEADFIPIVDVDEE